MSERATSGMTTDEFITWAMDRPEGEKYELYRGEVVLIAPERTIHSETELLLAQRLLNAIETDRRPCQVLGDSMTVQIDDATPCEPDLLVRCGPSLPADAVKVIDPLIVIEILSPSTRRRDVTDKLADYFRPESVRHYLVMNAERRMVIHQSGQTQAPLSRISGSISRSVLTRRASRLPISFRTNDRCTTRTRLAPIIAITR